MSLLKLALGEGNVTDAVENADFERLLPRLRADRKPSVADILRNKAP
jgi:hypothetical protein